MIFPGKKIPPETPEIIKSKTYVCLNCKNYFNAKVIFGIFVKCPNCGSSNVKQI